MWFNQSGLTVEKYGNGAQVKRIDKNNTKKRKKEKKQESLLSSTLNQYSTLLFCPFIEILLSQKKHLQHSSTVLPAPSMDFFWC